MLFWLDLADGGVAEVFSEFWRGRQIDGETRRFAEQLVRGVTARRAEIDRWITGSAENWRLERMAVVDRNVLRLAVFEMLDEPAPPPAVIIDEAIEVAKKYGSREDSGKFINGILDSIRQRLAAGGARHALGSTVGR
jgi:N utilization substance protein B